MLLLELLRLLLLLLLRVSSEGVEPRAELVETVDERREKSV